MFFHKLRYYCLTKLNININSDQAKNVDKYFCPLKYPTANGFEGHGYKSLFQALLRATGIAGFNIIKKGYTLNKLGKHARIVCAQYETYRGDKNVRQGLSYRNFSYHNNRKNT